MVLLPSPHPAWPTRLRHGCFITRTQPQHKSPSSSPPLWSPPACPQKISLRTKSEEITECSAFGLPENAPRGAPRSTASHNEAPFFTDDQFSAGTGGSYGAREGASTIRQATD